MRRKYFIFFVTVIFPLNVFAALKGKLVSFLTTDGQTLQAIYQKPSEGKPMVIFLHGLAAVKEEWGPLYDLLAQKGWGVLTYDARGHGESSKSKDANGSPNGYQYFGRPGPGSQWEMMINDVGAAIQFSRKDFGQSSHPIIVAGASLGANVALNFGSLSPSVKEVLLLSPGLVYAGIETEKAASQIKIPVLIVASPIDKYAFESSQKLKTLIKKSTLITDVQPGHGVQMFEEKLLKRIATWLEETASEQHPSK